MVSGDFVVHGLAHGLPTWPGMKDVINDTMTMIKSHFPKTPIIPNIGNNDLLGHYQSPNASERVIYYADLFDLWF
jgi:hypothetical protein